MARVAKPWNFNTRFALVWWVSAFFAFGPLALLLHFGWNNGAVLFGDNPPAFYLSFGITVASLQVAFMFFITWFFNRINLARHS